MKRIPYKFLGVEYFAVRKEGESAIEAVTRSIMRKPGVGKVATRYGAQLADRSDRIVGQEFDVTVCGPKANRGGWPVLSEFRLNIHS